MNKIEQWIDLAKDETQKNFRRMVHIILKAISSHHGLQSEMVMKGGILLAIAYHTGRYTKDIDFSTPKHYSEFQKGEDAFITNLNDAIKASAEETQYGILCAIQKQEIRPGPEGNYQTLHLSIGYALKSVPNMIKQLTAGHAANVVKIDYSFNETVGDIGLIDAGGDQLQTYGHLTLIAEKFRALLQQVTKTGGRSRGSSRGQDVFDLNLLLTNYPLAQDQQEHLLSLLISKANSRELIIDQKSISDPSIKERCRERYSQLINEIDGELPDFDTAFNVLAKFYESLPWPSANLHTSPPNLG